MSLDIEPSVTSNESHDPESNGQFGYGGYGVNPYGKIHAQNEAYGYNQLKQVQEQSLASAHPYHRRNSKDLTRDL